MRGGVCIFPLSLYVSAKSDQKPNLSVRYSIFWELSNQKCENIIKGIKDQAMPSDAQSFLLVLLSKIIPGVLRMRW